MLLTSQLADELGHTSQSIRDYAKRLNVGTLQTIWGREVFVFDEAAANAIREAVRGAKRGRPPGVKNRPKVEAKPPKKRKGRK